MIHAKDIKAVLYKIPDGATLSIADIQTLVRTCLPLSNADWEIHTKTRPTNYRKWFHRIQGVLADYKRKGLVVHDPIHHLYTF